VQEGSARVEVVVRRAMKISAVAVLMTDADAAVSITAPVEIAAGWAMR